MTYAPLLSLPGVDLEVRDHYLDVDGLRLHVRQTGNPDAPPVMMLHGMMGHAREWDTLAVDLADKFRVIALDQRGHGESDHAHDYGIDVMVADTLAVMDELGLVRPNLIGHSMGGMVGMVLAAEHPDAVDRLTVVDIAPPSLTTEWGRVDLPLVLEALATATYADHEDALAEWLAGDLYARESLLRHYVTHSLVADGRGQWRWRFDAARLGRFTATITEDRLWNAIDRIDAPTLLVRGESSHLLARDVAAQVVGRLADGRLVEIPRGGHDLGVQQPEAVASAVRTFLPPTS